MTLIIKNASKEFLPLFEEIAKISKAKKHDRTRWAFQ